jgi:hypothetical protein
MERDYPIGHPAASDFRGENYVPPISPYALDYDPAHPAHAGRNSDEKSTPDGMRAAHNEQRTDIGELAMVGSLPPLVDPDTGEALALSPKQLAHIYAVRKGLNPASAQQVTDKYNLAPEPGHSAEAGQPQLTAEQQAIMYIVSLGYTPERAKELFDKYGVPSVLADKEADAHR